MVEAEKYTKGFFEELETNSYLSAKKVLPIVNSLINPTSVIDIGCGTGEWLKVWNEDIGITDFKGVEGPYIKKELVKIANEKLTIFDLKNVYTEPRKYDLAMSLEVGEHLPKACSINLVKTLTQLSNVVLFSAALPGQEGTYHINEQYPEFWAALFAQFNFVPIDCIREKIWNTDGIEYWYKQNSIIYINESILPNYLALKKSSENVHADYLFRLHPNLYKLKLQRIKETSTLLGLLNWKWVRFKYKFLKKNA